MAFLTRSVSALAAALRPPQAATVFRSVAAGMPCAHTTPAWCNMSTSTAPVDKSVFKNGDASNNVPPGIIERVDRQLLLQQGHPLCTLKSIIADHFKETYPKAPFQLHDSLNPIVSVHDNFDVLQTPADHVSRSPSDTFYLSEKELLRCHTSAHQVSLLSSGETRFLVAGDVYRRDTVDATHYPVFHQMEGVRVFAPEEGIVDYSAPREQQVAAVQDDLKSALEGLVRTVFGDVRMRWVEAYFPFTDPSLELEIWWNDEWLEVLGCGVIHKKVLSAAGMPHAEGWAFGLGLERLAMVLFGIPDIRLFWTQDQRFHSQFKAGQITKFTSYSKYPPCTKDIAFWLPESGFHENDL